ncbi:Hsp90 protein-domain-containing protein [Mycena amicta]|nr:Hsp90 protein-domain-containing protein [Mycena amicta]
MYGWSEHLSPTGQPYYYNVHTKESTYTRPLPPPSAPVAKKKEKPLVKTQIPGTDWIRVKTTEGNVFYSHKVKKESLWTVPDEIRAEVAALEELERQPDVALEIDRVKNEVAEAVKRKAEDTFPTTTKKLKTDAGSDEESDEAEEEDWEKEAAAQLAAEAEQEKRRLEGEQKRLEEAEAEKQRLQAQRVDLSVEEAKALFKTLLREKDINPLHPWDIALPKFVNDPRYVLLSSVSARREAFDEYCRERSREIRQETVKKETLDPKEEFERFLQAEVKSTRTSWSDFRRTWKKDRRFYGWGRDDREREKKFKDWIRELGEKKRIAAQKAEADFFALLRERKISQDGQPWKDIKRILVDDPRYDAVGSSSLREELFNTFLKGTSSTATAKSEDPLPTEPEAEETYEEQQKRRKDRARQAVQERENKVRGELERVEAEIGRTREVGQKEEGETLFKTMLVDAVRDPQVTWQAVVPLLAADPRFQHSRLPQVVQIGLFQAHIDHLRGRHMASLHALFEANAPKLNTTFDSLPLESLLAALPVTKLGLDVRSLEREFERWQRERATECRKAFDEMLAENSFVEFWGKLRKIGGQGVDGGVKADDEGKAEDEGEAGGGKIDMKKLASQVDVQEIEKVLKNDKRYDMFGHVPEQRSQFIRMHLAELPSPKWSSDRVETWRYVFTKLLRPLLRTSRPLPGSRLEMRLLSPLLLSLSLLAAAQDFDAPGLQKEKHSYQSDVARLRKIVINSLYSHKDIFLRELISNANDALEKLRLTALTDKSIWDGSAPLNISIKAIKDEDGKGGRLVISDTGIGMSAEELSTNLGTLAKSGTSDFLAQAESSDSTGTGNLIGAFGLGFYSSFLVADRVYVTSIPPKSDKNPNPVQNVFSSSADDSSFEIFPDPRGNTLGSHGTEITLYLKDDSLEYIETDRIRALVNKHSSYSTAFPIYLFTQRSEEVPDEEAIAAAAADAAAASAAAEAAAASETPETPAASSEDADSDEAIVEEEKVEVEETKEPEPPKMKTIIVDEWDQLNALPPLWMRDPKNATDEDYELFYTAFWKDYTKPLSWQHFSGDSESGTSFKAILYLPGKFDDEYWKQPLAYKSEGVKLMVKRVFITSDLGEDVLPKWASWVKAVIDAEDLPLNVSRETLQSTRFLRQLKSIITKRIIQLFNRLAEDEEEFKKIVEVYGSVFKLGAVEDTKNRDKLITLARFSTNQRNFTSLDQYLENKKQGQKQIFYLSEMGKSPEDLAQSVFVEKLHARGYEVLLLNEPLDEILVGNLRQYKNIPFQDVAKAGLKFGDEEVEKEEKTDKEEQTERYAPLLKYLKEHSKDVVRDVIISNRLVASPCAVVADSYGYTANIQRMMSASNAKKDSSASSPYMHEMAKKAKVLEINPRSPLIEGMLRRVERLPAEDEDRDEEAEAELNEVASILIDGALVRSGFEVPNSNLFFTRVDRVLRRSLGVDELAPTDTTVKPAPPVDPEVPEEGYPPEFEYPPGTEKPGIHLPDHMKNDMSIEMDEIDEEGNVVVHDEL